MAISTLQNFYKETIAVACTTGATNIYVTTKPTPTNGYLVISSGTESLREIIKYTGTGTDGTGDYVTVASAGDRGLGGTTDQAHEVGETVRMNYTAEHQTEIDDAINAIVAGGAVDASTTNKGISKLSVAPASATAPIAVGTNDPRLNATVGLTADQEAAVAGAGAAPSASNKFLTVGDIDDNTIFVPPTVLTYLNAASPATWTKDAGLKYITVEVQAAGGNGSTITSSGGGGGGGGGGYGKKTILAASLGSTETVTIGAVGANSSFGSHIVAGYGVSAGANTDTPGAGGSCTGGDINISGGNGGYGGGDNGGAGGGSCLGSGGGGGAGASQSGASGGGYGGGGGGGFTSVSADGPAGGGSAAIVIVTEYY